MASVQRPNLLRPQPATHPAPMHRDFVTGRHIGHRAVPVGPDVESTHRRFAQGQRVTVPEKLSARDLSIVAVAGKHCARSDAAIIQDAQRMLLEARGPSNRDHGYTPKTWKQ